LGITRNATYGLVSNHTILMLFLTIGLSIIGGLLYILPKLTLLPGIKNNHVFHSKNTNRGWIGYTIGFLLIGFYIILYWYPEYMTSWMLLVDPVSLALSGNPASQWFFYGFLYTIAILVMGVRMLIKYRHSKYQMARTASVMFFQTAFAFLIPEILVRLNQPSMDLKNIWPLNYTFFYDYNLETLTSSGSVGLSMLVWGTGLALIGVPVITYFYGKRWYCSWVCGCGGLAETLGDPYRQLSDKSLKAWQVERWMVHGVLVFAVVMTFAVLNTYFTGSSTVAGINSYDLRSVYGFAIGAAFAGVVGVGFYPMMGNRVWCRFGCPLAAYLGIIQRFKSRFRITTNGGQCISCGNCSTYCEMGIDVRAYAQKGQNIVRASCVGCGVCSSVCPRGVLNLENKDPKGRFNEPILIGNDGVKVQS
ncbi:4Fe-4S binding protein, partial [Fulvivirga sp. RKSG066]|uniref:4Fe-4S binding protein n=1 Tax=Fulvivirga aurantia TaxID=2529383 RepID=UPI0012BC171D